RRRRHPRAGDRGDPAAGGRAPAHRRRRAPGPLRGMSLRGAASAPALAVPPGRQGPGPLPAPLVDSLQLKIARRAAGVLPGDRPGPGVGVGTELAQLRPYVPGDDVRALDPFAYARTGIPHVREYVPERALTTWLVL